MNGSLLARVALAVLLTSALAGCASTSAHFYSLDSTARPEASPPLETSIMVGPVTIPSDVDRPQLVRQVGPNQVTIDEFNRWASPLDANVARVVAGNLEVLLGTSDVTVSSAANTNAAYQVDIDVERFQSPPDNSALVEALWTVRRSADGGSRSGHTLAREMLQGNGVDGLVAAYSRALNQLSRDIAAAIRAEDAVKQ
ncbi:MAG: PqiC family protein [Salinisphaera sp.]|uniref:PqiC family protein n=1 Tax=Salinisphaera sp. TaxID=1914330 RepID=UPI003C7C063F